ncbi:MAG: LysR family transcriptional regulator, partial [Coprobacillus sp.]|nr:LysR family transcriptional regulator [Coprobacillus sp.]
MYNPHLKTFVYVVELGSFSKAAQKMYITPASVMKQINALEEHLHIKLVNRTHRGIKLTEQGQKVYDEAKMLIENSDDFLNKIYEKTSSIIRIGSSFLNPAKEFIDLWHSIPTLSQRYKLRVVPYEDDHDKIMEVYQSLGTK